MLFAMRSASFSRTPRGEALAHLGAPRRPGHAVPAHPPGRRRGAEETSDEFDPSVEFALNPYIPIDLGPIDLSINKAVHLPADLGGASASASGCTRSASGLEERPTAASRTWSRWPTSSPRTQIARPTLTESIFPRYFPYIATLFLFIAVNNLISFIPLPVSHESGTFPFGIPDLSLYAATANINVTLALTLVTFIAYNYEGIRAHGARGLRQDAGPRRARGDQAVHRRRSRSSRSCCGWSASRCGSSPTCSPATCSSSCAPASCILLGNFAGLIAIPVGVFFYIFEWVLIAGLQAFIFAMLSGIYIGFAVRVIALTTRGEASRGT